jgi:uncharacterized protein (TIGR03435 family)
VSLKLAISLLSLLAFAQQPPRAEFEVASLKLLPKTTGPHYFAMSDSGNTRVSYRNAALHLLVSIAYRVSDSRIVGLPNWATDERYDVTANLPPDTTKDQAPEMLQRLLEDRLKLVVHREQKQQSVYELVVGPHGAKLTKAEPGVTGPNMILAGRVEAAAMPMGGLAEFLTPRMSAPVIDKTGIDGVYQIRLKWAPDTNPSDLPDLEGALSQQLGLKLQSAKAPVEYLVITQVERVPLEN